MRLILPLLIVLLSASAANAEWKKVARNDSRLLLSMPAFEGGREVFEDSGWNDKQSVTTAYAALVPTAGTYPRMQVYWHQAAPLTYWKLGSTLDAAWIKGRVPFFKEKDVQVTEAAGSASPYLRQTRFSVGEARCVAFEMRVTGNPVGSVIPEERESVSGIYCPPIGTPLTDALVAQATEGIYVLRDGKIERALRGIETPIPAHIQRAEKPAQG